MYFLCNFIEQLGEPYGFLSTRREIQSTKQNYAPGQKGLCKKMTGTEKERDFQTHFYEVGCKKKTKRPQKAQHVKLQ